MCKTAFLVLTVLVTTLAGKAGANDSPKVDRSLTKEPKYTHAPRYFLLVFGPEAKTRVWCVFDGDNILYADLNGNGDLTDEGERFVLHKKEKHFLIRCIQPGRHNARFGQLRPHGQGLGGAIRPTSKHPKSRWHGARGCILL